MIHPFEKAINAGKGCDDGKNKHRIMMTILKNKKQLFYMDVYTPSNWMPTSVFFFPPLPTSNLTVLMSLGTTSTS